MMCFAPGMVFFFTDTVGSEIAVTETILSNLSPTATLRDCSSNDTDVLKAGLFLKICGDIFACE